MMENNTVWDACVEGCYFLIPLLILLLVCIYVFIERSFLMGRAIKKDPTFMQRIKDYLHEGEIESARNLCKKTVSPASRLVGKGLTRLGRPMPEMQDALDSMIKIETGRLKAGSGWLWMTAAGAPMLGLLGTLIGISRIFEGISVESPEGLKSGLVCSTTDAALSLITLMAGLTVGFVALAGYSYLKGKLNRVKYSLEDTALEYMDVLSS